MRDSDKLAHMMSSYVTVILCRHTMTSGGGKFEQWNGQWQKQVLSSQSGRLWLIQTLSIYEYPYRLTACISVTMSRILMKLDVDVGTMDCIQ